MNNKVNFKIDSWNLTRYIKVSLIYSFLQYTLAIFLSLLVFSIVTDLWKFDLSIPFLYSSQGDNLFTGTFIKTVIDTGWNNTNPYLGAPLHYDISNFPMAEGFHYLLIKLISYINSDYGFVMNVFFILSFPLSTFTALFVMKRIGISFPLALGGSVLFAMSYYHFKRYEGHLFLSSYYIIPLATWLAISVAENRMFKGNNSRYELGKTDFIYFIICILIGSSGIYYSVYSMFFIFVGAIIAGLRYKKIV
jgi:phosphoglycerol transferase